MMATDPNRLRDIAWEFDEKVDVSSAIMLLPDLVTSVDFANHNPHLLKNPDANAAARFANKVE
jgi:hypothetical protein